MEIKLDVNVDHILKGKVAWFAGIYLLFLQLPEEKRTKLDKGELFVLHLFGKLSLLYLTLVSFLIRLSGKDVTKI